MTDQEVLELFIHLERELQEYDLYEDGQPVGQQYPTDTGPMDIVAISRDRSRLLRRRASLVLVRFSSTSRPRSSG